MHPIIYIRRNSFKSCTYFFSCDEGGGHDFMFAWIRPSNDSHNIIARGSWTIFGSIMCDNLNRDFHNMKTIALWFTQFNWLHQQHFVGWAIHICSAPCKCVRLIDLFICGWNTIRSEFTNLNQNSLDTRLTDLWKNGPWTWAMTLANSYVPYAGNGTSSCEIVAVTDIIGRCVQLKWLGNVNCGKNATKRAQEWMSSNWI